MTGSAVRAQIQIADATFRRVRSACCWGAPGIDLDHQAALITLTVHRARAQANANARDRSSLDGSSAVAGQEVTVAP